MLQFQVSHELFKHNNRRIFIRRWTSLCNVILDLSDRGGVLCVESVRIGRVSEQRFSDVSAKHYNYSLHHEIVFWNVWKFPILYAEQSQGQLKTVRLHL
jgi:hypothetical protein